MVPSDDLEQWKRDLYDLLPWEESDSEAAEEIESDSFMAMMAKTGGQG